MSTRATRAGTSSSRTTAAASTRIGYPALTLFDRLVHLAELTTLAGAAFVLVLIATALFTRVARERPRVGRALLREIRASFYRKLFLAFVLASIIPVLIAGARHPRRISPACSCANVEAEAARAASVAQRVIEESARAAAPQRPSRSPQPSDDVMIWISQVIDQDVNVFAGPAAARDAASATCSPRACCRRAPRPTSIAGSCCSGCRASSAKTASASSPT